MGIHPEHTIARRELVKTSAGEFQVIDVQPGRIGPGPGSPRGAGGPGDSASRTPDRRSRHIDQMVPLQEEADQKRVVLALTAHVRCAPARRGARSFHPHESVTVSVAVDDGAARARHPDAITLDSGVQLTAVLVLFVEGPERVEEGQAALVEHALLDDVVGPQQY
jgi:hypothetical protein